MAVVLTVCHEGSYSSKSFEEGNVAARTVEDFVQEVTGLKRYVAKYCDDEGELRCLTAVTLPDALVQARVAGGELRLEVTPLPANLSLPLQSRPALDAAPAKRARRAAAQKEDSDSDEWVVVSDIQVSPGNSTPSSHLSTLVCGEEINDREAEEHGEVPCWACHSGAQSSRSAGALPVGEADDVHDAVPPSSDFGSSPACEPAVHIEVGDDHVVDTNVAQPEVEETVEPTGASAAVEETSAAVEETDVQPEIEDTVGSAEASIVVADTSAPADAESTEDCQEAAADASRVPSLENTVNSTEAGGIVVEEEEKEAVEAAEEANPGDDAEAQSQPEGTVLSVWDKACFVLAAFDADDDGRLDWKEYGKLQTAAGCEDMDEDVYKTLCSDVDCDPATGFDVDDLLKLYTVRDTLEQEYGAAMKHFEEQEADHLDARPNAAARLRRAVGGAVGALLSRARRPSRNSEAGEAEGATTRRSEQQAAAQVPLVSLETFLEEPQAQSLTGMDKVGFMLAAFDADQDGHLNYQEHDALQRSIDGHLDRQVFGALCEELGVDVKVGLSAHELLELHERWGTLEQAFSASVARLQSVGGAAAGPASGAAALSQRVMGRLTSPAGGLCRLGLAANPRSVSRETFRMAQCA